MKKLRPLKGRETISKRLAFQDMVSKGRARGHKGINHPFAKLNPEKAFEIRWYAASGWRHKDIAKSYEVSRALISAICRNEIWQMDCHD